MDRNNHWYENVLKVSAALLGSSLMLLSIYWYFHEHGEGAVKNSLLVLLAKELGMAGLIALVLNVSTEWVNRARHEIYQRELLEKLDKKHQETSRSLLKDVNQQLFRTVYQRNIDERVFRQVEKHLLSVEIMRKGFVANFTIEPLGEELVKILYHNKYTVVNLTDSPVVVPLVKAVVDVNPHYHGQCGFRELLVNGRKFSSKEIEDNVSYFEDRNFVKLIYQHEVFPDSPVEVEVVYEKVAPSDYSEVILTTVPMDKLELSAVDPQDLFTVEAMSLHPEDEKKSENLSTKFVSKWEMPYPILPGQGMLLMWHPRCLTPAPEEGDRKHC